MNATLIKKELKENFYVSKGTRWLIVSALFLTASYMLVLNVRERSSLTLMAVAGTLLLVAFGCIPISLSMEPMEILLVISPSIPKTTSLWLWTSTAPRRINPG